MVRNFLPYIEEKDLGKENLLDRNSWNYSSFVNISSLKKSEKVIPYKSENVF